MAKIVRHAYPLELSIGLLLLVFSISFFLSGQIFEIPRNGLNEGKNMYFGMFLVSSAIVIMFLVLWEEFLFPIKIKPLDGGFTFRNHRSKLKKQILIYCIIPVIFIFLYVNYDVSHVRFFVWAAICIISPVAGKLISGVKNYNDFLTLTPETIEYKNNEKTGTFALKDIHHISLIKDGRNVLHKVQLFMTNNNQVIIDLDEMEIEVFYDSINKFITTHYKNLLKEPEAIA